METMKTHKRDINLKGVYVVGVIVLLSFIVEFCFGSFPVQMFRFPLNILVLALLIMLITMMYRNKTNNSCSKFMLSGQATWLSLAMIVAIGIVLGLEREPSSTAWPTVLSILFIQSHLLFIIMRGWRNSNGIRWRFCLTHIGLLLVLGAGFWGAPDREQLRTPVHRYPSNEAYTLDWEQRFLPYTIELKDYTIQQSQNGTPIHYEVQLMVDEKPVTVMVNHPYAQTLSEKIYLVSFSTLPNGERYAVIEIVNEPWQWLSATGIIMLLAGAILLFIKGPKGRYEQKTENGKI